MELTWITFPTIVVTVSLVAYYAAYMLKGNDLLVNKDGRGGHRSGEPKSGSWQYAGSACSVPQNRDYTISDDATASPTRSCPVDRRPRPAIPLCVAAGTEVADSPGSARPRMASSSAMGSSSRRFRASASAAATSYQPIGKAVESLEGCPHSGSGAPSAITSLDGSVQPPASSVLLDSDLQTRRAPTDLNGDRDQPAADVPAGGRDPGLRQAGLLQAGDRSSARGDDPRSTTPVAIATCTLFARAILEG